MAVRVQGLHASSASARQTEAGQETLTCAVASRGKKHESNPALRLRLDFTQAHILSLNHVLALPLYFNPTREPLLMSDTVTGVDLCLRRCHRMPRTVPTTAAASSSIAASPVSAACQVGAIVGM